MNRILLPHLQGAEPATFLAAVGVLSLVTHELGDRRATIAWADGARAGATLGTEHFRSVEDLAAALRAIAVAMVDNDELLPGAGAGFPPRKEGTAPDPTRSIHRDEAAVWITRAREQNQQRTWIAGVVATNDVVSAKDGTTSTPTLGRTPMFDGGPGSMSASGTLSKSRDQAKTGDSILSALTVGSRQAGSIGGYLDWRADRDAADLASRRDPSNFGDPVVAWLALMSLRAAPMSTDSGVAGSSLCRPQRVAGLRKPLVWPVWRPDLTIDAVTVLLSHPVLDLRTFVRSSNVAARAPVDASMASRLTALGVTDVFASPRLSKGNSDGAYGPARQLWTRATVRPDRG